MVTTLLLRAQTASFPSIEPDAQAYTYAALGKAGAYTWQELAHIALWASGAEPNGAFYDRIAQGVEEFRASALPSGTRERGDAVLSFIHKRFFKSYSLNQTRIDTILTNGTYNCVSSAVFYLIFATSIGLDVQGVVTKDHAFILFNDGAGPIDIETTNLYGFDPGKRRDFLDNFGNVTGFAYSPPGNYRDRATISPLQLISLIMTNRLSMELRSNETAGLAVALNRAALLSEHSGAWPPTNLFINPQEDRILRLLSYGSSLLKAGREEDTIRWAVLVGNRYPEEPRMADLVYAALNNLFAKLIRAGRFADARRILSENALYLKTADSAKLTAMLIDGEITGLLNRLYTLADADNALRLILNAEEQQVLPARRITELRTFVISKQAEMLFIKEDWDGGVALLENALARYGKNAQFESNLRAFRANVVQKQAETLLSGGDWAAAVALIEEALARYGRNPQLENAIRAIKAQRVAELHNAFAALYNAQRYDEARSLIQQALTAFPTDRQLLQDKTLADQAR
jgi:tetratricopeptide (TPR) repeat protein